MVVDIELLLRRALAGLYVKLASELIGEVQDVRCAWNLRALTKQERVTRVDFDLEVHQIGGGLVEQLDTAREEVGDIVVLPSDLDGAKDRVVRGESDSIVRHRVLDRSNSTTQYRNQVAEEAAHDDRRSGQQRLVVQNLHEIRQWHKWLTC